MNFFDLTHKRHRNDIRRDIPYTKSSAVPLAKRFRKQYQQNEKTSHRPITSHKKKAFSLSEQEILVRNLTNKKLTELLETIKLFYKLKLKKTFDDKFSNQSFNLQSQILQIA